MRETIIVAARFRGPPDSGNGGYVSGLLARHIPGAAEVTLRAPTPLDQPLTLIRDGAGVTLIDGDSLIASARPAALALAVPSAPDWDACVVATVHGGSGTGSEFAGCFSCGRENPHGVQVWAGGLPGRNVSAAAWRPKVADADGMVPIEHLWAALDCPGAIALAIDEPDLLVMTGRMHGIADADCPADVRYRVIGWPVGREGRKRWCGTAVIDDSGRVRAKALSTWIAMR